MSTDRKRIVLVDDDDDFAAAVEAFLEFHGYEVHRAANGRDGVELAKKVGPDLVLMDVIMDERTDGFFAVQNLRRTPGLEEVPVFVVSSVYGDVPEFRVAPERGWLAHDRFFSKPVDLPELVRAIEERVGRTQEPATTPGTTP